MLFPAPNSGAQAEAVPTLHAVDDVRHAVHEAQAIIVNRLGHLVHVEFAGADDRAARHAAEVRTAAGAAGQGTFRCCARPVLSAPLARARPRAGVMHGRAPLLLYSMPAPLLQTGGTRHEACGGGGGGGGGGPPGPSSGKAPFPQVAQGVQSFG